MRSDKESGREAGWNCKVEFKDEIRAISSCCWCCNCLRRYTLPSASNLTSCRRPLLTYLIINSLAAAHSPANFNEFITIVLPSMGNSNVQIYWSTRYYLCVVQLKPRLHQIHVAENKHPGRATCIIGYKWIQCSRDDFVADTGYMWTATGDTNGYKWIQLVSGLLHVSAWCKRGLMWHYQHTDHQGEIESAQ